MTWLLAVAAALAIEAQTLHTQGPQGTLHDAVVLVREGRVAEVGPRAEVEVPPGTKRLSAAVVTPGLIDTHSVAGLAGIHNVPADRDSDEVTGPNQAGLRAVDGFNPSEPLLRWLLAHGVTVVQSGPGEANPIGGLAGVFKTNGETLRFPSALVVTLGEPPKETYGAKQQAPVTRMGTAAILRGALVEAEEWAREKKERDLAKEALLLALQREIPVLATARREDDILTALRIAREFDLELELADAVEGYLVADEIRAAGVPVHVGPVMERVGALETMNLSFENAAILAQRGIPITFQSGFEDYVPRTHVVLYEAALAGAWGLGFESALRALTIDAARRLRVGDRVGSIERGKEADLVLFDGDPFEYTTHVKAVVVDGTLVHQR